MTQLWGDPWCQESLIVPSKSVGFQYLNGNEVKIKGSKYKTSKPNY